MEESKAGWILRGALKRRTRRYRRRQVVWFFLLMLLGLLYSLGADHHNFRSFWFTVSTALIATGGGLGFWRKERLVVKSLDDRAQVRHGVNFDQLSDAEQKEILQRYRVWGYVVDPNLAPDEREMALRLHANDAALRFLRVALPCFAAAYWMVYLWVPEGQWRETLTDSPVLIMWLVVFVINLPAIIETWTEPDETGEPRVVLNPGAALMNRPAPGRQ
jgi:hypothetical protein